MDAVRARFWGYVDTGGECWLWRAGKFPDGYGAFNINFRTRVAHRVAFEFANGPIPPGVNVLHTCQNRACVRPAHLYLGNAARRTARGERHGSRTNPDNIPRAEQHYAARLEGFTILVALARMWRPECADLCA
jgi:hypothetical protein